MKNVFLCVFFLLVCVHAAIGGADLNADGKINIQDLVIIAQHLGTDNTEVDQNGDGEINILDLVLVAGLLGEVPIKPEIPEGMVLIPAGSFEMGSEAHVSERPVRTVHLDAFYMDKYEVTNAQFKAFVDANPQWQKDNIEDRFNLNDSYLYYWTGNDYPAGEADHPVVAVSWYAAMAYAEWAGKQLPTEAEWEYAARGGLAGQKYPWGDTITPADANYQNSNIGDTTPVGAYEANGYGLYDMAGNVWEWCLDAYDEDFYAASENSRNPLAGGETLQGLRDTFMTIPTSSWRVLRGGSWNDFARYLRVANRFWDSPAFAYTHFGFRCARGTVTP